jgi:dsDNA-binding SOS-regulon protein
MAVITKYVVVRNGIELDMEFLVKKDADAYDRMLDAADNLAGYIKDAELGLDLTDAVIDAISVFLAKNGPDVTRILKGLKPVRQAPSEKSADGNGDNDKPSTPKRAPAAKAKAKTK